MKRIKILLLCATFMSLFFVSCSDDETEGDGGKPTRLEITSFGVSTDTTIKLGAKIALTPVVSQVEGVVYSWSVDGVEKAVTKDYILTASETGEHTVTFKVSNDGGSAAKTFTTKVYKYLGGYYIVNEGWLGHDMGSVNYYDPASDSIFTKVYQAANEGMELGVTTQSGTIWNNTFYLVSKQGRRLVAANLYDMKDKGSIEDMPDGRAFAGIDESRGVVTTSDGAFLVNLGINSISLGTALDSCERQNGGVMVEGDYIFMINQNKGVLVYSKSSLAFVKGLGMASVGFAKTKDGNVWAANETELLKINPQTLAVEKIDLPDGVKVNNTWGAWNLGPFCAAKDENALYFAKSGMWGGGKDIYKYVVGDLSSVNAPFINGKTGDDFYGAGIGVNPVTGDVVATYTAPYGYDDNRLVTFDAKTGQEKSRKTFGYYWFPAAIVFQK